MLQLYIEDDFLTQVIKQPTRGDALLDFVLTSKEKLIRGAKVRAALMRCRVQDPWRKEKGNSRITALEFRRVNFSRDMLGTIRWTMTLERRVQKSCLIFQRSLPSSSRMVHSSVQKVTQRWQACSDGVRYAKIIWS